MNVTSTDHHTTPDYYSGLDDFIPPCNYEHLDRFGSIFMPCMYYIVFITGLIGNILVIILYVCYEKLKTLTDIYLVNLATADILFLFTLPFWARTASHEWIYGTLMCKLVRSLYSINLYSCMLTLTCITVDRYIVIARATKCLGYRSKDLLAGKVICICIWVLSMALSTPQFLYSEIVKGTKQTCQMKHSNHDPTELATLFQLLIGFLIPLLAMIICYSIIIETLIHAKGFKKHKSIKIIFAIVVSFIVLQLPYNVMICIMALKTDEDIFTEDCDTKLSHKYAIIITEAFAYMHCCFNPILYAFLGVKFRKNFWKFMKNYGCISQKQLADYCKSEGETSKSFSAISSTDATSMYPL